MNDSSTALSDVIRVGDILGEVVGQPARFREAYTTTRSDGSAVNFQAGHSYPIAAWNGDAALARVSGAMVPKTLLEPVPSVAVGVRRYDVGLDGQLRAINRNKTQLSGRLLQAERDRLTQLLSRRLQIYSQMWVRQMMYNRFDADILRWTNHYNSLLSPPDQLDPNVPKSIFFQESRMGTNGRFLLMPPYVWDGSGNHPIMSRFNLGQAIDSFGPQQWLMMREMASALWRGAGLNTLVAQRRWFGMTNANYLAFPGYMDAVRRFFELRSGGTNLMGNSAVDLHLDYTFWIRTAIRWLFVKKRGRSWSEAVRAYNGSGPRARTYRDAVMARVGSNDAFSARDSV